ncbi:MAG: 2-polyprenylphenol 6-hydroxylase, partial [Alphaproteobacteria bacterium]|nr:2-polyprenylphenol 6-hydroxylase [Alphaproteobacteria bacterium]
GGGWGGVGRGRAGGGCASDSLQAAITHLGNISRDECDLLAEAEALHSLGPTWITGGQSLAVRGDMIGDEIADDLSALQDALPAFSSSQAKSTIARELGAELDEFYRSFDEQPVAAASIAQVHFAVTTEDEDVAVKVLRPSIEEEFRRDIAFFYWLARNLERMSPESRRLKPVEVVANFEETVALEMDLRLEAAAAAELKENFAADPDFRVPAVDWNRTGQRVLTLERIDGIPIDETESLAEAGIDPREVLARSARAFFHQVFRDGFFHADMHPGNMFVGSDGVLSPVDFGIMGRLDKRTRNFLADMLIAFLSRDYLKVADVHFAAGYVPNTKSQGAFSQACRAIAEPILGKPQNEISIARLLGQLFQVTRTFEMETQPQLLLLQKTMLVAEGVGRKLDPDSNIWMLAEPLVEEWVLERRGPEGRMREFVSEVAARAERLPQLLESVDQISDMITADGLRLHPETIDAFRQNNGFARYWRVGFVVLALLLVASFIADF